MKKAIVFNVYREGYGIDQVIDKTTTVNDLISFLEQFDGDNLVVLSHDNGYTYGGILEMRSYEAVENEEGDFEEVE